MNPDPLQKRQKDLDAQAKGLIAERKALDEAPMTLKVYERLFNEKVNQLNDLVPQIKKAQADLKFVQDEIETQRQKAKSEVQAELEKRAKDYQELIVKHKTLKTEVTSKSKELESLKVEISQQRAYMNDQDIQIQDMVEVGNNTLINLQNQIEVSNQELGRLTSQRISLKSEADNLLMRVALLQDSVSELEIKYKGDKQKLEEQIETVRQNLITEQQKYKKINEEVDKKLNLLNEKEQSLMAKRDAVILERQELEEDQRRWTSTKSLYPRDML